LELLNELFGAGKGIAEGGGALLHTCALLGGGAKSFVKRVELEDLLYSLYHS
jgi:hypothetical protein